MRFAALALLFWVAFAVPAAHAGDSNALRATFSANYEAMKQATEKRDGKALGELLAPGFESVSINNESKGRDSMIRDIDALPPRKAGSTTSTFINDLRQVGDKVFVDETYELERVNPGRGGKSRTYRVITGVNDTWIKSGDKWLLQRSVANEANFFVDGEHVARQMRGKKMRLDKTYRAQLKDKTPAPATGGSCGGGEGTFIPGMPSCKK